MKKSINIFVVISLIATSPTFAAAATTDKTKTDKTKVTEVDDKNDKDEKLEAQLSYPELEVTPRASDRLDIEYKNESKQAWLVHLPIQFSALATLYAGTSSDYALNSTATEKDDYEAAQTIAVGVGSAWLVLTGVLAASYRPYRAGRVETSKLPKTTAREQLTRERIAEEALYAPAELANKLKWFSLASNLYATASLVKNSHEDSRLNIGVAVAASFAPLIFESRWSRIASTHRDYKKKIYGPLATSTLLPVSENRLAPGIALHWTF